MRLLSNPLGRRTVVAAAIACAAALTSGAALAANASPRAATTAGSPVTSRVASSPHLIGCNESSSIRPTRYNPICNDGAGTVLKLHWSAWSRLAQGRGEFYTHTCVPNCAEGKVGLYDVNVWAWRIRGGDYTRLRYYFPHSVPRGFSRSWTIEYYSGRWHGIVV